MMFARRTSGSYYLKRSRRTPSPSPKSIQRLYHLKSLNETTTHPPWREQQISADVRLYLDFNYEPCG